MLTGERPFVGQDQVAVLNAIRHTTPATVSDVRDDASPELTRANSRALEKRPEDRYQSVTELVAALRRIERVDTMPSTPRRFVAGAFAAVGLALAAIVGLYFWSAPTPYVFRVNRTIQLTREPGPELDPALSPDGKMVAYAAGRSAR